jgi:transcription termination/antitermination protein NusG
MTQAQLWKIGDHVGFVEMREKTGPIELPVPERWYVLQTYPNKEAKVMRTFKDRNISAYHPVVRQRKLIRGRLRDDLVPLFAGLIFIPDFQANIGGVFVDGVDRYMKFGDYYPVLPQRAAPIKHAPAWKSRFVRRDDKGVLDMIGIRRIEAEGNIPVARRRRLYRIGQLVRVVDGPFAMFNGTIERLDSRERLKLALDVFGRMTSLELDEGQIEAA